MAASHQPPILPSAEHIAAVRGIVRGKHERGAGNGTPGREEKTTVLTETENSESVKQGLKQIVRGGVE